MAEPYQRLPLLSGFNPLSNAEYVLDLNLAGTAYGSFGKLPNTGRNGITTAEFGAMFGLLVENTIRCHFGLDELESGERVPESYVEAERSIGHTVSIAVSPEEAEMLQSYRKLQASRGALATGGYVNPGSPYPQIGIDGYVVPSKAVIERIGLSRAIIDGIDEGKI